MLLHNHYHEFSDPLKHRVLDIIAGLIKMKGEEQTSASASAYTQSIWLAAIKEAGEVTQSLYEHCITLAGAEPDHPEFSSYMSGGPIQNKSPYQIEELLSWEIGELVKRLSAFAETHTQERLSFSEPDLAGLAKALRQAVKAEPLRFYTQLHRFTSLDLAFLYEIIEAYRESWTEKLSLPWDEIWGYLLNFCEDLVKQERFWTPENARRRSEFVANRYWVAGAIGTLIINGTRSDEHSFAEKYLPKAEAILMILLDKVEGEEFKPDSDAVFVAINSPRGICIEGLINLTLRSCRLSDKQSGNHKETWDRFHPIYAAQLARSATGEYEFPTLVANYLPNLLYIAQDWVLANLDNVFDLENYQKWLCAMQGYSYVGIVYQEIFGYMKSEGHFLQALDDKNLREGVKERIVENIAISFINEFEDLEDESSLINQLIMRASESEIGNLIWYMWTLRNDGDEKIRAKIFKLWPRILSVIDTRDHRGRLLASKLCDWTAFVDEVNDTSRPLIVAVAEYADEGHNSSNLLESIARISMRQPLEAYDIWRGMLAGSQADYPREAIRTALTNIVRVGPEGLRMANDIVSQYLKAGNDEPYGLLQSIKSLEKGA
jgi:hypothetical protein